MKRVEITRLVMGICHMQVCAVADATDEEILKVANKDNPSGTEYGWNEVAREDHVDKNVCPVICNHYPSRKHFIIIC